MTEDLIRRSWVRFPPRSKDFFFASCGPLFPFTRSHKTSHIKPVNAQLLNERSVNDVGDFCLLWLVILKSCGLFMGLSSTIIYTSELILCSTICVPSATRHNIHMYPYFLFAAIHHLKSSPTFSVRPCSSVGRVTEDLIRRSWFDSHRGRKIFSLPRVVPCFPLLGLTPSGLFMGLSSSIIYTSELILCSTN